MELSDYQNYIALSRYARWLPSESRRETWDETVLRYKTFFHERVPPELQDEFNEAINAIHNGDIVPSMRALMTAGPALSRDHIAGYNCAYLPVDHPRAFDEAMYILMCGTGVGFSVERQYISQLPEVPEELHESDTTILVPDSKLGWAASFREVLSMLYAGRIPRWDTSRVRPSGARLVTFGGRASGPEPLEKLFKYTVNLFRGAVGRKLTSLECHDLMCVIGDVVVVGGVRRSALISLSNLTDERMRNAKSGHWWLQHDERKLANNSVCYTEKPDLQIFLKEWSSLYESKSGERGIFNRVAARKTVERIGRRDPSYEWGCNPCSEIILRPHQFCNLTEVIVRPNDTLATLRRKIKLAALLGTIQASLTDFRYLRKIWRKNCEEERLLGVSLTGIFDHKILGDPEHPNLQQWLEILKTEAVEANERYADYLEINPATAVTCVKPSGTVSQLMDCASGIHPRYAPYYIRRVKGDNKDPLTKFLVDQGVSHVVDGEHTIFAFPMKAPEGSTSKHDVSAMEHLRLWHKYALHYCEHKPSITVEYSDDDFLAIGTWVYANFNSISGISFLPRADHIYENAPYEEITEEKYHELVAKQPKIDWSLLPEYETEDMTSGSQELACHGGMCEL